MLQILLKIVFFYTIFVSTRAALRFDEFKLKHSLGEFTDAEIQYLSDLQDANSFGKYLKKILVPRVVGTKNHAEVRDFIKETLENLRYDVEIDEFVDRTPFGNLTFQNIIATLNPKAERFLVVAAHYDSKYFENDEFVGATDSAVPCAMMLQMAEILSKFQFPKNDEVSLKLVFFDGEEAFVQWGPKDSLYGARHLAQKMHRFRSTSKSTNEMVTDLQRIDCLMLLDLLGHASPTVYNYFEDTKELFNSLSNAERKLYRLGFLNKKSTAPYFNRNPRQSFIEDDHVPFLRKDVPILHLIPIPFPDAWHTVNDNENILDWDSIHDIGLTIQLFVAQYLHVYLVPDTHTEL